MTGKVSLTPILTLLGCVAQPIIAAASPAAAPATVVADFDGQMLRLEGAKNITNRISGASTWR